MFRPNFHGGEPYSSPKMPFDFRSKDGSRCIAAILADGTHTRQLGYSKKVATSEREVYETKMKIVESMERVLGEIRGWEKWSVKLKKYGFAFPKVVQVIIDYFLPKGDKTRTNPPIPDFISNCDQETIGAFLSQFFDDEGSVDEKRKMITLKLCVNKAYCEGVIDKLHNWKQLTEKEKGSLREYAPQLLLDIVKLLDALGIMCKGPYFKGFTKDKRNEIVSACWQIYITYKHNIEAFYRKMGFSLEYKKREIEKYGLRLRTGKV